MVDKSPEGETQFLNDQKECSDLWKKQGTGTQLTIDEKKRLEENCMEDGPEGYYEILGVGCSWYCGGGQDTQTASSELKPSKDIHYSASNAHDLNYKSAWVEGVSGY
ncbi:MAG TPA: hypothetical protein PLZ32_15220, partial [Saprospiraceae bacterium]|nr:hypothetical protein [Saprospiraceae bacterium]